MVLSLSHTMFCSATTKLPRVSPSVHLWKPASNLVAKSSLPQPSLSTADADIGSHLHRHLQSPSPSIISTLCLAACALVGSSHHIALEAFCALDLAHVHSAVVSPRCHTELSSSAELMTSDGMMALVYEMIARGEEDAEKLQWVVMEVAGAIAASASEAADGAEKEDRRLPACGAACGAILGGGTEEEVERARRIGMHAGRAYAAAMRFGGAAAADGLGMAELELESFDKKGADHVRDFLRTKISGLYDETI